MSRTLRRLRVAALLFVAPAALAQDVETPEEAARPEEDAAFRALADEMERAKLLCMEGCEDPYYVQGFVTDTASFRVSASFGSITGKGGGRAAGASTDVRVGSPELDDTNFAGGFSFSFGGMGGAPTPLDLDYDALRYQLWLAFDADYKEAVESIAKKRAYLATNTVKDRPPDFQMDAPVVDLVLPREELVSDGDRWTGAVERISAVFRDHPRVHDSGVSMSAAVSHQYFLATDGARHRFPFGTAEVEMWASTQASDGMPLRLSYRADARTPAGLPSEERLVEAAHALAKRLAELADAPAAEDYWGPVLFIGDAACGFFLRTVADPLSHPRQPLGSTQGGRLIERLGRRIATRNLNARDDPTQKEWEGRPLLGHFPVDDDGVVPQPISLIESGVLKSFYMSRVPTRQIAETNGHSRAGEGSAGNLFVTAREPQPRAELERQLLEMIAEEDLEYGIVVEEFAGSGGGFSFGGGDVRLPAPALCYRLYKDGRRQLVRGATFKPAPNRILKDIVGLGDDLHLLNTSQFGQSVSVVAPSVLVEELELRRPQEEFEKPPVAERPPLE